MRPVAAVALCLCAAAVAAVSIAVTPVAAQAVDVTTVTSSLGLGNEFSAAVIDDTVFVWGDVTPYTTADVASQNVLSISSHNNYSCMLLTGDSNNNVFCIGNDPADPRVSGARTDLSYLQVSTGDLHACGLTADFQYWDFATQAPRTSLTSAETDAFQASIEPVCWGSTSSGNNSYLTPTNIGTTADPIAEVQTGESVTCTRTHSGRVSCDGLLDNADAYTTTQEVVGPTTENPDGILFSSIVVGYDHVCGFASDGRIVCWGAEGSTLVGSIPSGTDFLGTPGTLANGRGFSCVLRLDGTPDCFGFLVSFWDRQTPTTSFDVIAAGTSHACGIRTEDSNIECWGVCGHGECVPPLQLAPETFPCSELTSGGTCMLFSRNEPSLGSDLCSTPTCNGYSWDLEGECSCTRETTDVWTFAGATPTPAPGATAPSDSLVRCNAVSRTVYRRFSCQVV